MSSYRATLAGFVGALVVLAVLLWFVGLDSVVAAVRMADPSIVAFIPVAMAVWLVAWGLSLRVVLGVVGAPVRVTRAVLIYLAATFANNVTPFGQAGGEPVTAYLISEATGNEYEDGLAAIASVDALNFVPSLSLAALGLGYYAVTTTLGRQLRVAAVAVAVLGVGIPILLYVGWRYRVAVEVRVARFLTRVVRLVLRPVPGRDPPDEDAIRARIVGFFAAVERVADDRKGVALALGFSTLGWLMLATSLWLALLSLGVRVPFAAALVVVPMGSIASITPLPGGLGGIETVLVALLVPTTAVTLDTATAAIVLHRIGTYWLPTLIGGGVAAALGVDTLG